MNITYAAGAEDPRIDEILNDMAVNNRDAYVSVHVPVVFGKPDMNRREVSFRAPELFLSVALTEGMPAARGIKMHELSSKRSGRNTVVTIMYHLYDNA